MTNHLKTFKETQGKLEAILQSDQPDKSHGHSNAVLNWRNGAAALARELGQVVAFDDTMPDAAVARIYNAAATEYDQRAGGYWGEHKRAIVGELADGKLAKLVLGMPHAKTNSDTRNEIVKTITNYVEMATIIQSFSEKTPLPGTDKTATHQDVLARIVPYIESHIGKRYDAKAKEKDPTAKYVNEDTQKLVRGAILNLVSTSERGALVTAQMMLNEYKKEYEKALPNNAKKASFVRTSLLNAQDQGIARKLAYHAAIAEN